ncbi:DUF6318 family protein [Sinomonas cellulolyticus]|uniref:DUF6318 domain-containing protein n=1 Tax=Sinomonas cellulolyticus TaxID=2801916 RepID=A0ABS1JZJ5_9MICC|nr:MULTISPECIES: DUF6318 family protein [Sinomonas]MBL0704537.1 hypothetical protein [Sinomonas cellulolyticus]
MANRRRTLRSALSTLALAGTLGLTACGAGTSGPEAQGTPSAAASGTASPAPDARPTPASSTGPARNLPKPELPAAAKENTEAGFKAFTQYWFDTATYSLETGDSGPLEAISDSGCKVCNGYLADSRAGGWTVGPRWLSTGFSSDMKLDPAGQAVGYFMLEEGTSRWFDADGKLTKERSGGNNGKPKAIYASYTNGAWTARQLGQA